MSKLTPLLFLAALLDLCAPRASAAEIRTYRFIPDGSLPYLSGCGECASPVLGARAGVEGTFSVSLDPATSSGQLLALDSHLVNLFTILASPGGTTLQRAPITGDSQIIPAWINFYAPPLNGSLTSQGNILILTGSGSEPLSNGSVRIVPSYSIAIDGDRATFNMHVPAIDEDTSVTGAQAIQITPEPSSLLLALSVSTFVGAALLHRRLVVPSPLWGKAR